MHENKCFWALQLGDPNKLEFFKIWEYKFLVWKNSIYKAS